MSTDADVSALKFTRGQIKSQLTRFKTFIANLGDEFDLEEVETRLCAIETNLTKFNQIQDQIELLLGSEDLNERENHENAFYKIVADARRIIKAKANASACNNSFVSTETANSIQERVKLPKLNLPEFAGYYNQWVQFEQTFASLINNNGSLTDIEKFYYLKSCLKGDAAQLIHSLEISHSNYAIAWQMLKERYDNRKLIIHTHVKTIFELPALKSESHVALRKLLDNFNKNIRALAALGQPTASWDTLLVYILSSKLDSVTKREFEQTITDVESPKIIQLTEFIAKRCQLLETIENKNKIQRTVTAEKTLAHLSTQIIKCGFCKGPHPNMECEKFAKLSITERWEQVKENKICSNCLRPGHFRTKCKSRGCKVCNAKHHSLLHSNSKTSATNGENSDNNHVDATQNKPENKNTSTPAPLVTANATLSPCIKTQVVLLATAKVFICDSNGKLIECRALLDSGSMSNFITKDLAKQLKLKTDEVNIPITGISGSLNNITSKVQAVLYSKNRHFKTRASFLVMNTITENLPQITISAQNLNVPINIELADPTFYNSSSVDILLGADIFYNILCIGQIKCYDNGPILQKTKLGCFISGTLEEGNIDKVMCNLCTNHDSNEALRAQLELFWKVEDVTSAHAFYTAEEQTCEEHFIKSSKRNADGRFIVSLPFKDNADNLGESLNTTERQFQNLEKRLTKNNDLKQNYVDFMREYEAMGHMTETSPNTNSQSPGYYLPHHGVIKASSTTTKLRVVFNASSPTSSGLSLNDVLRVGPVIQRDLHSIVLKFRKHNVVLTADVEKMYRQVLVDETDRKYQKIVWREKPENELKQYYLNTITYGTAPASFLAVRCLHQAAIDLEYLYPHAAEVIKNDFYMDDLLTGAETVEDAILLKQQVTETLERACFPLRKWCSNVNAVFTEPNVQTDSKYIISDTKEQSVLGLSWNPNEDTFVYSLNLCTSNPVTKRTILSAISKLFDPLGFLNPTIVIAKLIMQELWQLHIDWDESVPSNLHTAWKQFLYQLQKINLIKIPRQVTSRNFVSAELHGFCDASERAYGAAIYIRTRDANGKYHSKLLCAKSRIAPLKTIALPRLELCGAVLLTLLMKKVMQALNMSFSSRNFWCDSTIVLHWLKAEPSRWKCFIANRVSVIQQHSEVHEWRHIRSELNPADIVSRGANPDMLMNSTLWWHGPSFLTDENPAYLPDQSITDIDEGLLEMKRSILSNVSVEVDNSIFERFSDLSRLQRVIAYVLRFAHNAKGSNEYKYFGNLKSCELENTMLVLTKIVQASHFGFEIKQLNEGKSLPKSNRLLSLNPFTDSDGLIRVGGRIGHSRESYNKKHPLLLPGNHAFTRLIIRFEHIRHLHAGVQNVLAAVRCKFWPLNGKNAVKKVLHTCVTCYKTKPRIFYPLMGDLPSSRLMPTRAFLTVGVDFAGPILIRDSVLRSKKLVKCYVCLFVCFATKAIHLELASDLTTEGFLNALKRFAARRGCCKVIYSDNATNFIGAKNELLKYINLINKMVTEGEIRDFLLKSQIDFKFIPPRSPNFGGLWEAAIKSAKTHLIRVLGDTHLNYEHFYTVLCQIEGVLNSRPLVPLSMDPNDLTALTPGHFLVGGAVTAIPENIPEDIPFNRIKLYQRMRLMTHHFWQRWSNEYLTSLQNRPKWKTKGQADDLLRVGALVLLKEDNVPAQRWRLGRIVELHPGADNIVRVVSVRTQAGTVKRCASKVSVLPIE